MGGSVSAGADNDEMIDNLIKSRYIRTNMVEKVFRSVDRAFYYLAEFQPTAYRDLAWKEGNLHLSAPCIYSEVLEHLKLETGHSFLNIGSGTGYLSTLAGLILGPYGTNHGIETHADVVEYAYDKLEQFKKTCSGVDVFEFCEPVFVVGNAFNLNQDRRYDRIYCGAACPESHQEHIKKFMKVGGILVLPCEDDLLKIVRTSEETWEISSVLPVSFSTLQFPDDRNASPPMISMPEPEPLRLQEICRSAVRSLLRSLVEIQQPELTQKRKCKRRSGSRTTYPQENCVVIRPVLEDAAGIESAFTVQSSRYENFRPVAFERLIRNLARNYQNLNDNAYEATANSHRSCENDETRVIAANFQSHENEAWPSDSNSNSNSNRIEQGRLPLPSRRRNNQLIDDQVEGIAVSASKSNASSDSENTGGSRDNVDTVRDTCYSSGAGGPIDQSNQIEIIRESEENENLNKYDDEDRVLAKDTRVTNTATCAMAASRPTDENVNLTTLSSSPSSSSSCSSSPSPSCSSSRPHQIAIKLRKGRFATKIKATKKHCSLARHEMPRPRNTCKQALDQDQDEDEGEGEGEGEEESQNDRQPKKVMKREKLDSGISEESDDGKFSATASNESSVAESASTNNDPMEIDSDQDSDFTEDSSYEENGSGSDVEQNGASNSNSSSSSSSLSLKYRMCIEKKIQALPLPKAVKLYLNYDRDFLSSSV